MAIKLLGGSSITSSSIALPTHKNGDLILIFAYRGTSNTPPSVPTSSATTPTWITMGSSGSNGTSSILAYAFATRSNHTSGTWTNATRLFVIILQNVASFGRVVGNSGSSNSINYPELTPQNINGTSVICAFGVHALASSTSGIDTPPTGMRLYFGSNTSSREVFHYSNRGTETGGLGSFSSSNISNIFSGAWRTWVFELKVKRSNLI